MSTNAQPRVLGRWCRTSRWCTLVHARRAFVAPADATSASCDARGRDDSGRQRPRVAPSADRNVRGPRRLRGVTSASRNVERRYVSEWRDVSELQCQSGAPSASRNVKRAKSARNVGAALRQSAETSAWREAGLRCSWRRTRPFSRNDGTRHTVQNINRFTSVSGVPLFGLIPVTSGVLPRPVYWHYV